MNAQLLNNLIEKGGLIRCIDQKAIEAHKDETAKLAKRAERGSTTAIFIGVTEAVVSAAAMAVFLSNPVGWGALVAIGTSVVAGGALATNTFSRVQQRRIAEGYRELSVWEQSHFQPWLDGVINLANELLTLERRELLQTLITGTQVDHQLVNKALGMWVLSMADSKENYSIEDHAFMSALDHINQGFDQDQAIMETLFEAIGECDVVFANSALGGTGKSLQYFPVWIGPKAALSGTAYLTPISETLACLVSSYYTSLCEEQKHIDRVALLTVAYYVHFIRLLSN